MSFLLEVTEFEADFNNCREYVFRSVLIKETALLFHQYQDAIVVKFCHPARVIIATGDFVGAVTRNILPPKIQS